jgi:hypothetical protein
MTVVLQCPLLGEGELMQYVVLNINGIHAGPPSPLRNIKPPLGRPDLPHDLSEVYLYKQQRPQARCGCHFNLSRRYLGYHANKDLI